MRCCFRIKHALTGCALGTHLAAALPALVLQNPAPCKPLLDLVYK